MKKNNLLYRSLCVQSMKVLCLFYIHILNQYGVNGKMGKTYAHNIKELFKNIYKCIKIYLRRTKAKCIN